MDLTRLMTSMGTGEEFGFVAAELQRLDRDIARVEEWLHLVESRSLRRLLQEWFDANNENHHRRQDDNNNFMTTSSTAESLETIGIDDDYHNNVVRDNSQEEGCCHGCWEDPNRSFWKIRQEHPECIHGRHLRRIKLHQRQHERLAYGVSYKWVTEPLSYDNGRYEWEDLDSYFAGPDHNWRLYQETTAGHDDAMVVDFDSPWNRTFRIPVESWPAGSGNCILPSAEVVASNPWVYDIIFYAGEYGNSWLRHHRTARGTLTLSAVNRDDDEEEDASTNTSIWGNTSNHNHNRHSSATDANPPTQQSRWNLQGTVEMDSGTVKSVDFLPPDSNGTFMFHENSSWTRVTVVKSCPEDYEWDVQSQTSVMFVQANTSKSVAAAAAAAATTTTTMEDVHNTVATTGRTSSSCPGEIRVVRDRITAHRTMEQMTTTSISLHDNCCDTQLLQPCLWMHSHTSLPADAIERIQAFVSPPATFELEPGDLVLDMDWSSLVGNNPPAGEDRNGGNGLSTSCLVARRRPSS